MHGPLGVPGCCAGAESARRRTGTVILTCSHVDALLT
eukprot:COSAG06_NODE_60129_length_272_cov_0.554913_1_plen_36_part_01